MSDLLVLLSFSCLCVDAFKGTTHLQLARIPPTGSSVPPMEIQTNLALGNILQPPAYVGRSINVGIPHGKFISSSPQSSHFETGRADFHQYLLFTHVLCHQVRMDSSMDLPLPPHGRHKKAKKTGPVLRSLKYKLKNCNVVPPFHLQRMPSGRGWPFYTFTPFAGCEPLPAAANEQWAVSLGLCIFWASRMSPRPNDVIAGVQELLQTSRIHTLRCRPSASHET